VRAKSLYVKHPWKIEFFSVKQKNPQMFLITFRHLVLLYCWTRMVTSVKSVHKK